MATTNRDIQRASLGLAIELSIILLVLSLFDGVRWADMRMNSLEFWPWDTFWHEETASGAATTLFWIHMLGIMVWQHFPSGKEGSTRPAAKAFDTYVLMTVYLFFIHVAALSGADAHIAVWILLFSIIGCSRYAMQACKQASATTNVPKSQPPPDPVTKVGVVTQPTQYQLPQLSTKTTPNPWGQTYIINPQLPMPSRDFSEAPSLNYRKPKELTE